MVQQAAHLIARKYVFWSSFVIPAGKPNDTADEKLLKLVDFRRGKRPIGEDVVHPLAKCRYLRFERWGILLATQGRHPFFELEPYRDCRVHPIQLFGYSIGYYKHQKGGRPPKWHATVSLSERQFFTLKTALVSIACEPGIADTLGSLPVVPYAGVRTQLFKIRKAVNDAREAEDLEPLDYSALPVLKRKSIKVFAPLHSNRGGST